MMRVLQIEELSILTHIISDDLKGRSKNLWDPVETDEESFKHQCETSLSSMIIKSQYNFLCCIDGSIGSHLALEATLELRRTTDTICLFHAYDDDQQLTLPTSYQAHKIREKYEFILSQLMDLEFFSFDFEEKAGRAALVVLRDLIQIIRNSHEHTHAFNLPAHSPSSSVLPDFVVLGYIGCTHSHDPSHRLLGSTADLALRTLSIPCIIAKAPSNYAYITAHRSFLYAVNFSEPCRVGLQALLRLLQPTDKLRVVYLARSDVPRGPRDRMTTYYSTQLSRYAPPDSSFSIIPLGNREDLCDAIVSLTNTPHKTDYLALAPRPKLLVLSPIAERIIQAAKCNIILCKN
jgi:hypothetical protein